MQAILGSSSKPHRGMADSTQVLHPRSVCCWPISMEFNQLFIESIVRPPSEGPGNFLYLSAIEPRKNRLNAYLFRFHLAPSPSCTLYNAPESVPHFLLCPAYRRQRLDLIRRLGTACLSLKLLLSAKNDAKPVLDFVRDNGRLPR
ncbi:hypothetical protein B0H13DRAFT_2442650 [Mycena leptocephala]|nr:hypothetical protein B0H13DRAFT_2442650 [Mycena leptocephala]